MLIKQAHPLMRRSNRLAQNLQRFSKLTRKEMANIDVQKKRSNPLPWVILLILILAVVGYFIWRNYNTTATAGTTTTDTTTIQTDTTRP